MYKTGIIKLAGWWHKLSSYSIAFYISVGRFVKHTGYGNAAGLLARRGLLMGGRGDNDYSSTDEDSDTEEYVEKAHL